MKPLELFLGVLTAVGGFVDISELVFMSQAGSRFQYSLIWVIVLATVGIMVFGEMSGRVAAMSHQPLFNTIRHRLGFSLGAVTLAGALISTLITCAAEIGGVALVLQLLSGWNYALLAVLAAAFFMLTIYLLPFKWIERSYGLLGLFMIVFGAAIETCLACAYAVSQFFGWRWGRHKQPKEAPLFTLAWIVVFVLALGIVLTGIEATELADYAIVTSIVVLPLSFLPLLLVARDRTFMRDKANGVLANTMGWAFYAVIVVAALLAIPLYLMTSGGKL